MEEVTQAESSNIVPSPVAEGTGSAPPQVETSTAVTPVTEPPALPKPEKPKEPEVMRDEHGRLMPGSRLNPDGRGAGNLSLVRLLRDKLEEIPEGEKKSYAITFIETVIHKALVEKDVKMLIDVMNRIDGKPMQPTELKGQLDIKGALVEFLE